MGTGGSELIPETTKRQALKTLRKEQEQDIRAIAPKNDDDIDFSDAHRVPDWSGAEIGKFYRPKKKPTATGEISRFPNKSKHPHQI